MKDILHTERLGDSMKKSLPSEAGRASASSGGPLAAILHDELERTQARVIALEAEREGGANLEITELTDFGKKISMLENGIAAVKHE